jgi:lincosamide nucleotidyltransferase A/C/D/E
MIGGPPCRARLVLPMMTAEDVVFILDRLDTAGVAAWLDGGWAVDAVLGEVTREHADLDLIVRVDDVATMRTALAADGFELTRGEPRSNFVLGDRAAREIDVHPVRFDARGDGIYRMENGDDWTFPAAGFTGTGRIGARDVRCLTPDVQMLCHATGYEPDEIDVQDMRLLHERLGTALLAPFDRLVAGR